MPPPWGTLAVRLGQQQAGIGRRRKDPPAAPFLHERFVVERRLEAQQAQPESVLTAGLAVASPRVAAQLGENRHHLVGEMDRQTRAEFLDGHRNRRRDPADLRP